MKMVGVVGYRLVRDKLNESVRADEGQGRERPVGDQTQGIDELIADAHGVGHEYEIGIRFLLSEHELADGNDVGERIIEFKPVRSAFGIVRAPFVDFQFERITH